MSLWPGAQPGIYAGGCSTFWGKTHPSLVSSALHSPPTSSTRCFPTTLNISSLPPTHPKAGGLGFSPGIFLFFLNLKRVVRGSSPRIFLNVYIALHYFYRISYNLTI